MRWSYKIARIAGIDVYLHTTFLLLVALYGWIFYQQGGMGSAIFGVVLILLLFLCVLLHEFGHAFAARAYGIRTPDITLLPIGGVARLERMPTSPLQEFVIAIAGPAVNVVIIGVLAIVEKGIPPIERSMHFGGMGQSIITNLISVNMMLVLFNMIPAFPMDGGRVLRALLATQFSYAKATAIAARVGQSIAVLFILVAVLGSSNPALMHSLGLSSFANNPFIFFIALFIFTGAQQELAMAKFRDSAMKLTVGQVMITQFEAVSDRMRAGDVNEFLRTSAQQVFPVIDDYRVAKGLVGRGELMRAAHELPPGQAIASFAKKVPLIAPATTLISALELMNQHREPVLIVVNQSEQIVGLLSHNEALQVAQSQAA